MAKRKSSSPDENPENISFEDSFARLSEMAAQLEAGGMTLAEATARFEEGMKLVQYCNELLNNAELKITELKGAYRADDPQQGMGSLNDWEEDSDDDPDE